MLRLLLFYKVVAVMLLGNDMLDVKGEERLIGLMQATILATPAGPRTHQSADGPIHAGSPLCERRMRDFALRTATK